ERVLLFPVGGDAVRSIGRIGHVPGSHHLAGAHRGGQTNHVGVNLQARSSLVNTDATGGNVAVSLLIEQTILGLTSSQVQLHDFEVVSQTDVVGLDVLSVGHANRGNGGRTGRRAEGGGVGCANRSFHAVVRQSDSQGTVSVTQTSRHSLLVQIVVIERGTTNGDITIPTLRTVGIERITNTKLEAREVRGLVHDHVIETGGVSG